MSKKRALVISIIFLGLFVPRQAWSLTVRDVASDLMCTCGCSLVLSECHMSCGLTWKEEIGKRILAGQSKEEIIAAYVKEFGREDALATPMQRLKGKIYQVGYLFLEEDMRTRMGISFMELLLFPGNFLLWGGVFWLWRRNVKIMKEQGE